MRRPRRGDRGGEDGGHGDARARRAWLGQGRGGRRLHRPVLPSNRAGGASADRVDVDPGRVRRHRAAALSLAARRALKSALRRPCRTARMATAGQPSRSRRPGRSSSQVSRRRRRRGCSGGSTVPGWSASTTGPSRAARRRSCAERGPAPRAIPASGRTRRTAGRRARATVVGGRTREAIRRPMYSSSVPAIASGTIGAPGAAR